MLDRLIINAIQPYQNTIAHCLLNKNVHANQVTYSGFFIGMLAPIFIISNNMTMAIICILLNRIADGLDGTLARLTKPTDQGAFLDIVFDFLFYASIPLGFAFADPANNALAASLLIYSFIGTGCSFLAFAIFAKKRQLHSQHYPNKSFYYLGGLTEASESTIVFLLMCLLPSFFPILAYCFASLCLITLLTRIYTGYSLFASI